MFQFLKDLQEREVDKTGLSTTMLDVVIDADEPTEKEENFIANYGALTLEQATTTNSSTWRRKVEFCQCCMASLMSATNKELSLEARQFRIDDK